MRGRRTQTGDARGKGEGDVGVDTSIGEFVDQLASSAPAPGGGAACALAGAVAAALAEMVGQLTAGRAKYRDVEPAIRDMLAALGARRAELLRLIDEDAAAYRDVAGAYGLPRGTDEERAAREAAIQRALGAAMEPPQRVARAALEVLRLAERMGEIGNASVASDAGCAALLAEATVRGAGLNVLANVVLLRDAEAGAAARAEQAALEAEASAVLERTLATVRARMGV